MAVLILPVLHREVVPPHREVVPVDRYNRCLERLYRSRIGPEVVPLYHMTGLCCGTVVGRLWAGCTAYCLLPVVPVLIEVVPLLCYSVHNGQIHGDLFKGVFFPNGSPSLELVFAPIVDLL